MLERATVHENQAGPYSAYCCSWYQGLIWYGETSPGGFPMVGHTGGDYGVSTRMFCRPERGVGVVTLTNAHISGKQWALFTDIETRMSEEFS